MVIGNTKTGEIVAVGIVDPGEVADIALELIRDELPQDQDRDTTIRWAMWAIFVLTAPSLT